MVVLGRNRAGGIRGGGKNTPHPNPKCLVQIIAINLYTSSYFLVILPPLSTFWIFRWSYWGQRLVVLDGIVKFAHKFHWKENSFLLLSESFLKLALLVKIYGLATTKSNCKKKSWPFTISCAYFKKYKSCFKGWLTYLLQFCQTTTWWIPDNCLTTALQPPDDCLITAWRLPDNYLMTAWRLPDDCLKNTDNCLTTVWHPVFTTANIADMMTIV